MYSHIRGKVEEIGADRAVIEAAGVGYELFCSRATLSRLLEGKEARLFTHFNISQDAVALYGFYTDEERTMFRRLIGVSRIGPKLALAALSVLSPQDISLAVLTDNAAAFDGVPGMGRKTAARVILELKEKVETAPTAGSKTKEQTAQQDGDAAMRHEAIEALVALGYDGASAGRAVAKVENCSRVEDMIMQALRALGKK
ncbi:MAG: Holliday junction branch migration protein RuvA [Clostridia bacterium]|nr:Holliday junction branch migration protein RuvA [Clostridia bacterium]